MNDFANMDGVEGNAIANDWQKTGDDLRKGINLIW